MTMYNSINTSILPSLTHGTDRTLSSHVNHINKADVMVIIKNLNPNESHLWDKFFIEPLQPSVA